MRSGSRTLGPDNLVLASNLSNLAEILNLRAKYIDAETVVKRALTVREHHLGFVHPQLAESLKVLGDSL